MVTDPVDEVLFWRIVNTASMHLWLFRAETMRFTAASPALSAQAQGDAAVSAVSHIARTVIIEYNDLHILLSVLYIV